ncbi:MAG TPA: chorismate mutase [Bacillota bacterium]|nr:chorismate mutase [Bacillota bacterium]
MPDEQKLADLRRQIDDIDEKMVALINERARLALQVGIAKGGQDIYQPSREKRVLDHVTTINKGPLSEEALLAIYRPIIEVCKTIQYNK